MASRVMSRDGTRILSGRESAEQRLRDALGITRGSYAFSRDYGSRLADVVDANLDEDTEAAIYAAVADTIAAPANGLGDLRLRSVRVQASRGRVEVDVDGEWVDASGAVTPIGIREQLAAAP